MMTLRWELSCRYRTRGVDIYTNIQSSVQFKMVSMRSKKPIIYALHPVYHKFPQRCFWNGCNVRLIDDGPLSSFHGRSSSASSSVLSMINKIITDPADIQANISSSVPSMINNIITDPVDVQANISSSVPSMINQIITVPRSQQSIRHS